MSFPVRNRSMVSLFVFCVSNLVMLAQEPSQAPQGVPPESDYMYRKHYAEVEQIMKAPLAGRSAKLETYMQKLHPKSKILQYMASFFTQIARDLQAAGRSGEADAVQAKMAKMFPEAAAAAEAQAFQQAFQAKDYTKAIQLGEKIYAKNPDPQVAVMLAQSYIATKNVAKALEYSEKVLESLGPKKGVYFGTWLAAHYRSQGNRDKALEYYNRILRAYPSIGPEGWTSQGWAELKAAAYAVRGTDAYVKQDYAGAVQNYEESLQYEPHNEAAYLFLGLSQWKRQKLDLALDAFAKGTVLNKPNSAKARQYLEQLYKARNNDSLEGLDALLEAARQALGIGGG